MQWMDDNKGTQYKIISSLLHVISEEENYNTVKRQTFLQYPAKKWTMNGFNFIFHHLFANMFFIASFYIFMCISRFFKLIITGFRFNYNIDKYVFIFFKHWNSFGWLKGNSFTRKKILTAFSASLIIIYCKISATLFS